MDIYCASPLIPPEWIEAHGLEPRPVWLEPPQGAPATSAGMCAFARSAGWLAQSRPDSAIVFTTHCDQLRRCFDTAGERAFLFNLPATWRTSLAREMFRDELERLGRFLVDLGGRAPSRSRLKEIIEQYGIARAALLEAAPALGGRAFAGAVAQFQRDGSARVPQSSSPGDGAPVAIAGGPLPPARFDLFDIIEKAGGRVALNATECGELSLLPAFAPNLGDPIETLARIYTEHPAVHHRPNTPLYDWLKTRLAARGVRGIVLWAYVGCDLWRAEAQSLREAFGLPVLLIDNDGVRDDLTRAATRLEAFMETLK